MADGAALAFALEALKRADNAAGGGTADLSSYAKKSELTVLKNQLTEQIAAVEGKTDSATESVESALEKITLIEGDLERMDLEQSMMSRTITATTEQEVREALQFVAEHPGANLKMTLAADLNATVPTLYLQNANVVITGTRKDGVNSNVITFEQTTTTSNLHFENTTVKLSNLDFLGNNATASAARGTIRAETGSTLYINQCRFGQAEGSANIGCGVEYRDAQGGLVANTEFTILNTTANACGIYCSGNVLVTAKTCSFSADSVTQNIARLELGAHFGQIDTAFNVVRTANHGTVYRLNGEEQTEKKQEV